MPSVRTSDFDYPLPAELIAQKPAEPRDSARLLIVHRDTGKLEHRVFRDITDYLGPNDVLIRNDTRVVPARLRGRKVGTNGKVEVLLLRRHPGAMPVSHDDNVWEALVRPAGRLRPGHRIEFEMAQPCAGAQPRMPVLHAGSEVPSTGPVPRAGDGPLNAEVIGASGEGTRLLRFPDGTALERWGETPLPPYIREPIPDPERYQTVYAREPGSAAAPTAGLHFTPELLTRLQAQGVEIISLTLHIGLDTFRPVRQEDPREHGIHKEFYHLTAEAAQGVTAAAQAGKRLVCVGTTSVRAMEDAARRAGWGPGGRSTGVRPFAGFTGLYILPGFEFLAVDALITNFHLPRTTLLMLVSAFAGRDLVLRAYDEAVRLRYRFYSFGDALLIL